MAEDARWQAISDHECEFFPRGRVVYNAVTGAFILYADRRLQREATISANRQRVRIGCWHIHCPL